MQDRTIPAPPNTLCGDSYCQRRVAPEDLFIVRYNGKIFHRACFAVWHAKRVERKAKIYAGV